MQVDAAPRTNVVEGTLDRARVGQVVGCCVSDHTTPIQLATFPSSLSSAHHAATSGANVAARTKTTTAG